MMMISALFHQQPRHASYVTENFLKDKKFTEENTKEACPYIHKILPLDNYAPGGFVPFRRDLAETFFFKFFQQTQKEHSLKYDPSTH